MFEETITVRVRALAEAFREGEFVRMSVADGDFEVEMTRTPSPESATVPTTGDAAEPPPKPSDVLTSDVVGVIRYARPAVAEGQQIENDRDIAYIETLGIRNPVRSRGAGKITAVYVTDGQPVEYSQPLFAIER